jgi:hypothetical protein
MELTTGAFEPGGSIPDQHSRPGGNVSPLLRWSGVPSETVELMLTCTDPDAPSGTFVHWVVAGIPPNLTFLPLGADRSDGLVAGRNGFGDDGYGGPEPPPGDAAHRYVFRLHALAEPSGLTEGATYEEAMSVTERAALATVELVGRFGR